MVSENTNLYYFFLIGILILIFIVTTDKQSDNSMVSDMNEGANKGKVNFCHFFIKQICYVSKLIFSHIYLWLTKKAETTDTSSIKNILDVSTFGKLFLLLISQIKILYLLNIAKLMFTNVFYIDKGNKNTNKSNGEFAYYCQFKFAVT